VQLVNHLDGLNEDTHQCYPSWTRKEDWEEFLYGKEPVKKEPVSATKFKKGLKDCYEDAVKGEPCRVKHKLYDSIFTLIKE